MTASKKTFLNVIFGVMGQVIVIILGIIIPRLVLVGFGSEVNGLLNSVSQILVYFSLFEAGIGAACLQALYAPAAREDRDNINGIMSATNIFYKRAGLFYALSVVVLALIFPFFVKTQLSYGFIAAVILFGGLGNSINFLYEGKYKILMQVQGYSYVISNITTIVNIIISLGKAALLLLGYGVIHVQILGFVISIMQMLLYYIYVKKHYSWVDLSAAPNKSALSEKNATFIHQIASMVFNNTDMILLTVITNNLKIVSIYSMYNLVTNSIFLMLQQIPAGVDFKMGQLYNTDKKRYIPLFHILDMAYLILGFAAMTTVYIIIVPFMKLYTAGINDINYIEKFFPLLFVLVPIITIGRFAPLHLINHAGHFKKTQWRAVIESAINICVSVVGIYYLGIYGALLGTICALLYRTNDMILYSFKNLLKENPISCYKRWIGCIAIFILVVYYVNIENLSCNTYLSIIGHGILYGIILLLAYTLVQALLNPREFQFLFKILKEKINDSF